MQPRTQRNTTKQNHKKTKQDDKKTKQNDKKTKQNNKKKSKTHIPSIINPTSGGF